MSSYSVEFGQEEYIMLYGVKTAKTIPFNWLQTDHNNATLKRGPSYCDMCKKDGMFEGIFYGLCTKCCTTNGFCPCVYCRVAKKDGHKRTERRINICNFIKTLQSAINDLRRDYPDDEYGIVKEGIETGYYILNLHTKYQYEKMEFTIDSVVEELPRDFSKMSTADWANLKKKFDVGNKLNELEVYFWHGNGQGLSSENKDNNIFDECLPVCTLCNAW